MTALILSILVAAGPADVEALVETARQQLAQGELLAAEAAALAAVAADPENLDALWAAALVSVQREQHTEAAGFLTRIVSLDRWDDEARVLLAQVQAKLGERELATRRLAEVLDANPAHAGALAVRAELAGTAAGRWQPFARAGIGAGYDSNLGLTADGLPQVSRLDAAIGSAEVAAGVMAPKLAVPLTLVGLVNAQTSLSDREATQPLVPSTAGLAAAGRIPMGQAELFVDLRYTEVFVESFATHYERQLSPSLGISTRAVSGHELRLLVGGDAAIPDDADARTVLKATVRDELVLGRARLLVELGGRRRLTGDDSGASPGEFSEGLGVAYLEVPCLEQLAGFALARGEARRFDTGLQESTYGAQLGLRYRLEPFELHLEYGFATNLSGKLRSYDRHQVGAGVRYWYF